MNVLSWMPESDSESESESESKAGSKVGSKTGSKAGSKAGPRSRFCPLRESKSLGWNPPPRVILLTTLVLDTCRAENCQAYVDRIALFCDNRKDPSASHGPATN